MPEKTATKDLDVAVLVNATAGINPLLLFLLIVLVRSVHNSNLISLVLCGNGKLDAGEQCDGGAGCEACACKAGFQPTSPLSTACTSKCGNGVLDAGEQCEVGGTGMLSSFSSIKLTFFRMYCHLCL